MTNFERYECEGQMELVDYLDALAEETKKCEGCIYFGHNFKCVREVCHKIDQAEGWHPIWYDQRGRVYGDYPTNKMWLPVITVCEKPNGKIYSVEAEAKDKTFRWSTENSKRKSFDDRVIAWIDDSEEERDDVWICRTRSKNHDRWSVINGIGTYGGYTFPGEKNEGLLEVALDDDVLGYCKAEELYKLVEIIEWSEKENNGQEI